MKLTAWMCIALTLSGAVVSLFSGLYGLNAYTGALSLLPTAVWLFVTKGKIGTNE